MTTTVLTIGYDGSAFHGFARQDGPVSVQGTLEHALGVALRRPVETVGAGRTDTGVHARAQVVSFQRDPGDEDDITLMRSLNALAGPHIVVSDIRSAPDGFSARHDALSREYRYLIVPGPVPPLALKPRSWWVKGDLDLSAMRVGAGALIGEHDFTSFCVAESAVGKRTVRDIAVLEIDETEHLGERCVEIRIVGRSFLHSMVRIVVGTLVEVGKGRRTPEWVASALSACDRAAAGPTAPPEGLTLWSVRYPPDAWL